MNLKRTFAAVLVGLSALTFLSPARAQTLATNLASASLPATAAERPLPEIATLMRQVEAHQRAAEAIEKDYVFHEDSTLNERNSSGDIKKTEQRTYEIFWLGGVRLARLIRKDGKDLSANEVKKEEERLDKEVAKARERRAKADADGKQTNSDGRPEITVSRILELGSFSNPRRETVNGRPTIVVEYSGDPAAKTHNPGEAAMKLLTGNIWVDEQDSTIQHAEGHFTADFKVGGGLVASIRKDTSFKWTSVRIRDEVWLPSTVDAQGQARYLLFFSLSGDAHIRAGNYRKFKATSTVLPMEQPAASSEAPASPGPALQTPPSNHP